MVHIKVTEGLDIPMQGAPKGDVQSLAVPTLVGLNLLDFPEVKFKLFVKAGDVVKIGQPLACDKKFEKRMLVSPAAGIVKEIKRGLKRSLEGIVIEVAKREEFQEYGPLDHEKASSEQIQAHLLAGGLFAHIRQRPFNILATPIDFPRAIFVKAVETAPFAPPAELQVQGHEGDFQTGLSTLARLTGDGVHLVYHAQSRVPAFTQAQHVNKHTVEGPHPAANQSVHIAHISPIQSAEDIVWTVTIADVVAIGHFMNTGRYWTERIIAVGGTGIAREKRAFVKGRIGYPIGGLMAGRSDKGVFRMISGDVLTGETVGIDDFLRFNHNIFSVIPEHVDREFLHFFRLGIDKYSASRAYFSGHLSPDRKKYSFDTNQHGEERYFVDGSVYQKVMPMRIPVMQLVQSLMAQDFETAEELGLFEVDSEDFALPTFVDPSKIEMRDIVKKGLLNYYVEMTK